MVHSTNKGSSVKKGKILIIDDDLSQLELLEIFLTDKGYTVECAPSASEGLNIKEVFKPDVLILDVHLPDGDGLELLQELREKDKGIKSIIITAYHDMETTVKAMKIGACEYITKPIDVDELEKAVRRTFELVRSKEPVILKSESSLLKKGPIIGNSNSMKEIFKKVGMLSENRVTVLIEGETGTGKELIAKAIHSYSTRSDQPFLAVNCSAIVGTLLESELFGHEKGSFTGALVNKKGKFELAGEGTLFLDEVAEIPLELQAKLLRILQEREFERVGGEKTHKSQARVIAATNRDLEEMVHKDSFREDLFYRLSVARIHVPPLRDRKEDIIPLVEHLLKKINAELGKNIRRLDDRTVIRMLEYGWPGNVRQLENILTSAAIVTHGEVILDETLSTLFRKKTTVKAFEEALLSLEEIEREHILKILNRMNWHLSKTAQILGISRPTLRMKMRGYKIAPTGQSKNSGT